MHGVSIGSDLLKKKLWKGQAGEQGFKSFMQLARPHFRPANAESGRASPLDEVLAACFKLLENLDRAMDEMEAEKSAKATKDARTEAGEREMNDTVNPGAEPVGRRSRKGKNARQSRSPVTALTNLGMPTLVQRAWFAMTDHETTFYADHPRPTPDEDADAAELASPGWSVNDVTKEWRKVDRHMLEEYRLMLDEGDEDWADHHKMYTEWITKQTAMTKTKLALMLCEVESVPGADAPSEMGEIAKSMQAAAAAQAAAVEAAARARLAASALKEDTRAAKHRSDATEKTAAREAATAERREDRLAQTAATASLHALIGSSIQAVVPLLNPAAAAAAAAAAAPPPAAVPSSSSGSRQPCIEFGSIEAVLRSSGVVTDIQVLMSKFEGEGYDWPSLRSAFCSGTLDAMADLKEIGVPLGDRRKIVAALEFKG